jgi:hypothetical protein
MKNKQAAKLELFGVESIEPSSEETEPMHRLKPDSIEERASITQRFDNDGEPDFSPLDAFMDPFIIHREP